jgi:L-ascorbate metabolism protein UlaG (beta-lactamase superfamily)
MLKLAGTIPAMALPSIDEGNNSVAPDTTPVMKIQRLAWAGVKIQVGDTTLFVDASVNDGDPKLTSETDGINALITHHHGDHYDQAALKTILTDKGLLVLHEDVSPWIDVRNFRTQTVKLYEPVLFPRAGGDLVAISVPAVDGFGHPQVSWVIEGGGKRVIHCGDTLWHGNWSGVARTYGPFDIAFLPINGFRQVAGRYVDTGVPMSLTPEQAVAAARLVNAKMVCPIHYGRSASNYFEVPDAIGTFTKSADAAKLRTAVLKPGEWVTW